MVLLGFIYSVYMWWPMCCSDAFHFTTVTNSVEACKHYCHDNRRGRSGKHRLAAALQGAVVV